MASFLNKAKEAIENTLHSDKGDTTKSGTHGTHSTTHGSNTTDHVSQSTGHGTHNSNLANKAEERFDSSLDNRHDPSSRVGGYDQTQTHGEHRTTGVTGGLGSSDTYGSNTNNPGYDNTQSGTAHKSNLLNKLDPRSGTGNTRQHDDEYSQSSGIGGVGRTGHSGHTGTNTEFGTAPVHHATTQGGAGHVGHSSHEGGLGHSSHTGGLTGSTTTETSGYGTGSHTSGPHSSNLLNKADPRFDSDRDHRNDPTSRVGGYGTQDESYGRTSGTTGGLTGSTGGYGADTTTGGYGGITNTGRMGEIGDTNRSNRTGEYGDDYNTRSSGRTAEYDDDYNSRSSGNTQGTSGPHKSNALNKLDPRVDSDLDGSKTYGGNETRR